MYLTTKSGRKLKLPNDEEDAKITAAAKSDLDALPWTEEELARVDVKKMQPPDALISRLCDLIQHKNTGGLSAEEASELDHYLQLEHLMRLAKART
ncbi:MAG: Unknown protein [uncultured Thiotrichaceae bacterium]|uniref:Uncharacterized protein n=1 Tax=uncultured Thiotrichaceae bacterium TaxID=298394 RepID=A0A6S6TRD0_9GAMM|nr:MAG: Unknown protein [uncultured Thiotrichaceae bacterium]